MHGASIAATALLLAGAAALAAGCGEAPAGAASLAGIEALAEADDAASNRRLGELYRTEELDPTLRPHAARALVARAERLLARGDLTTASALALDVYLSSAPADARLRALTVYARGARTDALARLEHIVEGRLDRAFLSALPALLADIPGTQARELERRLARSWKR